MDDPSYEPSRIEVRGNAHPREMAVTVRATSGTESGLQAYSANFLNFPA
jgi:hypothetical protein